jgi:hypothetical protein
MEPSNNDIEPYITLITKQINLQESVVGRLFFTTNNVQTIQNMIRYQVHQKINVVIGEQPITDGIGEAMKVIYLKFCRNFPQDITPQILELNQLTVDSILPTITSNVLQYQEYLNTYDKQPIPLEQPKNENSCGTNVYSLDTFVKGKSNC